MWIIACLIFIRSRIACFVPYQFKCTLLKRTLIRHQKITTYTLCFNHCSDYLVFYNTSVMCQPVIVLNMSSNINVTNISFNLPTFVGFVTTIVIQIRGYQILHLTFENIIIDMFLNKRNTVNQERILL